MNSSNNRKPSAKSEKVSINCNESSDKINSKINKTEKKETTKKKIKVSKSLGSFNLFDNVPDEESSSELDINSAIEKQKAEKYKDLKFFLSEVKMPDYFGIFAKNDLFSSEKIENLSDYDLKKMKIGEKDRKIMLSYIKELKMRNELTGEGGGFGTQCDSVNYCNDPVSDNFEENERIQSELFRKAVEEFRNRGKEKEELPQVDKSIKSSTTNISETIINPKNFLLEIGNSDQLNLNNLCLFSNNGNNMKEDQEMNPELVSTQACWNCLKIMNIDKALIYEERLFCSEKCVEKYKKKNDLKCFYCHKNFLKYNAIISGDKFFCSTKCFKDEKKSIKEIEGKEEDEENDENQNKLVYQEPPDDLEKVIDILDI